MTNVCKNWIYRDFMFACKNNAYVNIICLKNAYQKAGNSEQQINVVLICSLEIVIYALLKTAQSTLLHKCNTFLLVINAPVLQQQSTLVVFMEYGEIELQLFTEEHSDPGQEIILDKIGR